MSKRPKSREASRETLPARKDPPARKNLPAASRALIANVRNDITIPGFTTTLRPLDETLLRKAGGRGLALYDEIERDPHAFAVLTKRKTHLVGRAWEVEAGGTDAASAKAADLTEAVLKALPFDRITADLGDATLKGFAVAEIVWMRDGAHVVPERIVAHDPRRFVFDADWRPRLLTREAMADGIALPDRNFIVHRFGVRGNNPYGLGLGSRLFWAVLFKREGVSFWLHYMERFAAPVPVGKHPVGMLPSDQEKILASLAQLAEGAAVLVPIGTELDYLEAKRAGEAGYEAWCRYWDEQISECVLGETLTTNIQGGGSRAASETHAELLDQLVDADGDLQSATFAETLLAWLTDYNVPGATPPRVWRPRPANEAAIQAARKQTAEADVAEIDAAERAAAFLDRIRVPGYMLRLLEAAATGADGLVVDLLRAAGADRQPLLREPQTPPATAEPAGVADGEVDEEPDPAFSAFDRLFAAVPATCPACFADSEAAGLLDAADRAAAPEIEALVAHLETVIAAAADLAAVSQALLTATASLPVDGLATAIGDGLVLAELAGRAEVIDEAAGTVDAAAVEWGGRPFDEQVAFLRGKVALPSRRYTDLMHAGHDRGFIVAGATATALVEDLQAAVVKIAETGGTAADFRRDFERIVGEHGWTGWTGSDTAAGRAWRARTIIETNLRTSHQAGRLKQMREVSARRPWWQYRHGVLRKPKSPRADHVALDGKVYRHDDPIWSRIYPPNDWGCTCGVRTLSDRDMARLGKSGGDVPPTAAEIAEAVPPEWRYQPGDTWERGLVPPELQAPLAPAEALGPRMITTEPPLAAIAEPIEAPRLPEGQASEDYVAAFLGEFGAAIGQGVVWRDKAGQALVISDQLFQAASGGWKVRKGTRGPEALRLAEAIRDPDEIWVDWAWDVGRTAPRLVRRYLRFDPTAGGLTLFEWSRAGWSGVTSFTPKAGKSEAAKADYLNRQRTGALLYRRPGK